MDARLRELHRAARLARGKEGVGLRGQLWNASLALGVWPEFVHRSALQTAIEVAQFASWLGDLGARQFLRSVGAQAASIKVGVSHHLMLGDSVPTRCSVWCCERMLPAIDAVAPGTMAARALQECMQAQLAAEAEVNERLPSWTGWPPIYKSARFNFDPHLPGIDSALTLTGLQETLRQIGFEDTGYPGSAEDLMHFSSLRDYPGYPGLPQAAACWRYAAAFGLVATIRLYSSVFRRSLSAPSHTYGYIRESRPLLEPANMFLKVVLPMCETGLSLTDGKGYLAEGRHAWVSHGTAVARKLAIKDLKAAMRQQFVPWATSGVVPA